MLNLVVSILCWSWAESMTNTRANHHTHIHWSHVWPPTINDRGEGLQKQLQFFWDSFEIHLQCSTAKTLTDVSVPSQILGLKQHIKQKPCVCSSQIPAKLIYYSWTAPIWALALSTDDCSHGYAGQDEQEGKQNELSVVVHWWGSSEIKYLFMQAWKLV